MSSEEPPGPERGQPPVVPASWDEYEAPPSVGEETATWPSYPAPGKELTAAPQRYAGHPPRAERRRMRPWTKVLAVLAMTVLFIAMCDETDHTTRSDNPAGGPTSELPGDRVGR